MTLEQLRKKKRKILKLAESFGVESVMVFGSTARSESDENSDVDFLVEMKEGSTILQRIGFKLALEKYLKKDVDVITVKALKGQLSDTVRRDAVAL